MWLGLSGMKKHDLRSSSPSCGCGWVGVSQIEELRRPFVSLYELGCKRIFSWMKQDFLSVLRYRDGLSFLCSVSEVFRGS